MPNSVALLRALVDWLWPIGTILGGLTGIAYLVANRAPPPQTRKTPARIAFIGLVALLATTIALGSGSCFVASALAGVGICPFTPRGAKGPLDPVDGFMLMQFLYLGLCILCIAIAVPAFLHVLPGKRTGWERLLFILSFGARGTWR